MCQDVGGGGESCNKSKENEQEVKANKKEVKCAIRKEVNCVWEGGKEKERE